MAGLLPSWLLTPVAGRVGVACKLDTMMTLPSPIASRLFISASLRLVIAPCVALLLCAAATSRRADRIEQQLARCADQFLGAALRECLRIDPATHATEAPGQALQRWAREFIQPNPPVTITRPQPVVAQQAWNSAVAMAYRATDAAMALN